MNPRDPVGYLLLSGDREHGCSRVDANDLVTSRCESAGEGASTTADVENRPCAKFAGDRQVDVQVVVISVEIVIDRRQSRLIEYRVGHHVIVPRAAHVPAPVWPERVVLP